MVETSPVMPSTVGLSFVVETGGHAARQSPEHADVPESAVSLSKMYTVIPSLSTTMSPSGVSATASSASAAASAGDSEVSGDDGVSVGAFGAHPDSPTRLRVTAASPRINFL